MAMLPTPVFESWGSTDIKVIRYKYTWTINNFSLCPHDITDAILSPTFSFDTNDELKWRLDLYPYGEAEECRGFISVFLIFDIADDKTSYISTVLANYSISILNNNGKQCNKVNYTYRFLAGDGHGTCKFLEREVLFSKRTAYLNNDSLVILCEMEVTANCESTADKFISSQTHLANDFAVLLQNKSFYDVILQAGEKQFKAHKAILAARSPVFRAMFEHNMEESENGLVKITEFDHQVVGEMLRYIYSEKISNMRGMAPDMLAVAEKFAINGLKDHCTRVMCASLSMKNVVKFFTLADLYQAAQLKASVKQYIYTNVAHVVKTPEWTTLRQTHPCLVKELFSL